MRPSGRAPDEMRAVRFTSGFTKHAAGSVLEFVGELAAGVGGARQ